MPTLVPTRRAVFPIDLSAVACSGDHVAGPGGTTPRAALQRAREVPQNRSAAAGWAEVFGIRYSEDVGRLLTDGAALWGLAADTRRKIEALSDDDPGVVLEHFSEVEQTLANFQGTAGVTMESFLAPLRPTGEQSLKLCSSLLRRRWREPVLNEEAVKDLLMQLRALLADIEEASDLDLRLRAWLIDRLREVEQALVDVRLRGYSGVEAATDRLVGGLLRQPHRSEAVKKSRIATGFVALLTALDLTLNVAANLDQITSGPPQPSQVILQIQQQTDVRVDLPQLPRGRP